ncbi:hypothetical protein [Streptomyces europaeiscabiei]|nr:hypothetical protein OHB30_33035 [Streptomyces europaeiscabiei]
MKSIKRWLKDRYQEHVRPHVTPWRVCMAGEAIRWTLWLIERGSCT